MNRTGVILFALTAQLLSAQIKRSVEVTVTEPRGRLVTGLDREHFEVMENGVRRPIDNFVAPDSPIVIAVLGEGSLPDAPDLFQTASIADAVSRLSASSIARKVLVISGGAALETPPVGIQVVRVDPADLATTVVSLRNQYHLEFGAATLTDPVVIVLKQPERLPRLTVNWK